MKGHCCPYIHLSSQKMPEIAYTKYLQPNSWRKHSTTLPWLFTKNPLEIFKQAYMRITINVTY